MTQNVPFEVIAPSNVQDAAIQVGDAQVGEDGLPF
jgi:hypothetical protein